MRTYTIPELIKLLQTFDNENENTLHFNMDYAIMDALGLISDKDKLMTKKMEARGFKLSQRSFPPYPFTSSMDTHKNMLPKGWQWNGIHYNRNIFTNEPISVQVCALKFTNCFRTTEVFGEHPRCEAVAMSIALLKAVQMERDGTNINDLID